MALVKLNVDSPESYSFRLLDDSRQEEIKEQLKKILIMGDGILRSGKGLKAIYAILHSIAPDKFTTQWDSLFFSLYSEELQQSLNSLMLETGEITEILWCRSRPKQEPIHHIYFLSEQKEATRSNLLHSEYELNIFCDFTFWSLPRSRFPLYWSYLLEMASYDKLTPLEKEERNYLPLLGDEQEDLKLSLKNLNTELKQEKISLLNLSALAKPQFKNYFLFLPFNISNKDIQTFGRQYIKPVFNSYIKAKKREDGKLEVSVQKSEIKKMYDFIKLDLADIEIWQNRLEESFDSTIDLFFEDFKDSFSKPTNNSTYTFVMRKIEERQTSLRQFSPQYKDKIVARGKMYLGILHKYFSLAQWRYDHIINGLERLASVTQETPILLSYRQCPNFFDGQSKQIVTDNCVGFGFEFTDEFRKNYLDEFKYEFSPGCVRHLSHIFQPEEIWKAIHVNRTGDLLKERKPITIKY